MRFPPELHLARVHRGALVAAGRVEALLGAGASAATVFWGT